MGDFYVREYVQLLLINFINEFLQMFFKEVYFFLGMLYVIFIY